MTRSPDTIWEIGMERSSPPRRTRTSFAVRMVSLSTMRLARTSWKTPITRLAKTTMMNAMFLIEPVVRTRIAMATLIALKSVSACSAKIRPIDLVLTSVFALVSPCATRSATSASLRPDMPSQGQDADFVELKGVSSRLR